MPPRSIRGACCHERRLPLRPAGGRRDRGHRRRYPADPAARPLAAGSTAAGRSRRGRRRLLLRHRAMPALPGRDGRPAGAGLPRSPPRRRNRLDPGHRRPPAALGLIGQRRSLMGLRFKRMVQTVDSHTEGNATRVIVGGVKAPPGATLLEKRAWLWRNDDGLRRMLNFEPRGSGMMCSVLLLPAEQAGSDFAVVIMEQDEYVPMCGHCIIGTATTVVATGMVPVQEPVTR